MVVEAAIFACKSPREWLMQETSQDFVALSEFCTLDRRDKVGRYSRCTSREDRNESLKHTRTVTNTMAPATNTTTTGTMSTPEDDHNYYYYSY